MFTDLVSFCGMTYSLNSFFFFFFFYVDRLCVRMFLLNAGNQFLSGFLFLFSADMVLLNMIFVVTPKTLSHIHDAFKSTSLSTDLYYFVSYSRSSCSLQRKTNLLE